MPPRFFLSEQDLNSFKADQWLQRQNEQLADDWLEQQLNQPAPAPTIDESLSRLGSGFSAPQAVPQAATPTPPPDAIAGPTEPSGPSAAPQGFNPDLLDLSKPAPVAPDAPLPGPPRSDPSRPAAVQPSGGFVDYARQAAQRAGIDPDLFVRQINQESGFDPTAGSPAGARGIAQIVPKFHPGVDVTDPYASLDYAAKLMASHLKTYGGDISKALVAYNGGQGAVQAMNAGRPYQESQEYLNRILGGGQTMASTASKPVDLSLSQFGDKTISADDAYAACGPAAASRLAAVYGNSIPLSVALAAAEKVGWTRGGGMNGIQNEKKLMDALGLPAELDTSGDWTRIVSEAGQGRMVTISTPGHYFSASGSRPRSDGQTELYVGQSGLDLKGGKAWMTPAEIEQRMGALNGALFSDPSRAVAAGEWMQRAAADHGVEPETPEQVFSQLDQARQKAGIRAQSGLEQITQPFGEAFRQIGDVAGQVGGALTATGAKVQSPNTGNPLLDAAGTAASAVGTGLHTVTSPFGGPSEFFPTGGPLAGPLVGSARGIAGTEQLSNEYAAAGGPEMERQLLDLLQRQRSGEPNLDPQIDDLTARLNQVVQAGQGNYGERLNEAAVRNPNLPAMETGAGLLQGAIAAPLAVESAPMLARGAAAVIDPMTGLPAVAGRAIEAASPYLRARQPAMAEADFATGGLSRLIPARATQPQDEANTVRQLSVWLPRREGPPGISVEPMGNGVGRAVPEAGTNIVYRDESGMPQGILSITDVAQVAVNPAFQRQGIATRLYQAAKDAGIDIEALTGKGGYTPEGAAFAQSRIGRGTTVAARAATPPSITGPKVGKMAGTAAEQAAVGAPEEGRAANILLEKFPAEVRPFLQDAADRFGQFAGQRRGVITDAQAEANAAEVALGTTVEKWIKTPAGKAFNQEQAIALGNTLAQVGKEYDDLLTTTRAARAGGSITPEMEAQLADKTLELAALAGVRSGAAAEAGRALRSFRQALGGGAYADRNKAIDAAFKAIGTDKERFAQWVEEFSQLDDPQAKYKMLQGLQEPSWWDRISLLRYASMLSSTTTHMVNAFGNVVNVGLDVALKPVSVGIDVTRARITGGERTRYMGELAPQVRGLLDGAVAGFFDGVQTLKTGINPRDLGKFEDIRPGFQAGRGTSTIMGAVGGGVSGGVSAPENATLEERLARVGAGAALGAGAGFGVGSTRRGLTAIDTVVEMPLRLLGFSDNVFRGAAFGGNARAAAARKGIQEGLSGQALRTRIIDIMQNLPAHPDIVEQADKAAATAVLQESNRFASAVTSIGRGTGAQNTAARIVREIIVPFAKTPANIFRQGAEMTPYGLLKVRDLSKAGDVGGATDAAARVAFGSALMVGMGALAANGAVTGGYPADSKERDTLPPGWQPWSLRLPNGEGGHTYVSFSQLGPVAIPMAIGAIAGNTVREGLITDPGTVAGSLGRFMVDQTFLQGISALADAFKDPKRYGENFTEQMATSFVPYAALSREVTRILGQADRDPKGAIQAIQALVPGVAENVLRRQDALGRDIRSTQTGIGAAVSPAKYSSTRAEPVLSAFRGVGLGIPDAPKEIRITSQVTGSTSPPIKLTEQEQNEYQRIFGEQLQKRLLPMVTDPAWERRTLDGRKTALEAQMKAARAYAESQVYGKMAPEDRQRRMQEGRTKQQTIKPLPMP